jgi:nucleotide-binding universal stress UspA family protein
MQAQQILVPIDFSDSSRHALQEADALAVLNPQAKMVLLHVHPIVESAIMDTSFVQPADKMTQMCDAIRVRLREWANPLKTPDAQIVTRVVTGSPTGEIVEASLHADLLVMGTHGRAGLRHFLLGSVAERVVQGAHCSVLIVKKNSKGDSRQLSLTPDMG